jgi:hypothetical protein
VSTFVHVFDSRGLEAKDHAISDQLAKLGERLTVRWQVPS